MKSSTQASSSVVSPTVPSLRFGLPTWSVCSSSTHWPASKLSAGWLQKSFSRLKGFYRPAYQARPNHFGNAVCSCGVSPTALPPFSVSFKSDTTRDGSLLLTCHLPDFSERPPSLSRQVLNLTQLAAGGQDRLKRLTGPNTPGTTVPFSWYKGNPPTQRHYAHFF